MGIQEDLKREIAAGEGLHLDFKKTVTSVHKIARTMVAFANASGGKLLVGVNDNGIITGVRSDEDIYMLETAATFYCNPPIKLYSKVLEFGKISVIETVIPESKVKPHAAKDENGKWWVYIRVNDQSQLASKELMQVLKLKHSERQTVIRLREPEQALFRILESQPGITVKEFASLAGIPRRKASQVLVNLTAAGVLELRPSDGEDLFSVTEKN